MKRKLFLTYLVIIGITVAILGLTSLVRTYRSSEQQTEERYTNEAKLLAEMYTTTSYSDKDFVTSYGSEYGVRLTLIDMSGNVTADSAVTEELDNHSSREEVQEAMNGSVGTIQRYSNTMKMQYFYVAIPTSSGNTAMVMRLSLPLSNLEKLGNSMIRSILATIITAVAAALAIAYFLSHQLTEPIEDVTSMAEEIANGNYGGKIYTHQKDQIGRLAESFTKMSLTLKKSIDDLKDRNEELETMLKSMTGGVVAIDSMNHILFLNDAFRENMNIDRDKVLEEKDFYVEIRSVPVYDVIDEVRSGGVTAMKEAKVYPSQSRFMRITGTPLNIHEDGREHAMTGVLLVIDDITEIKKLENMRSEFVANVTHELKTPLTSIRGFVETLKGGAIKDEKVARRFLDIIDIESERLYNLIQDILLLSEIENRQDVKRELCDVNKIMTEAVELLRPKMNRKTEMIFEPEPYIKPYPGSEARLKELVINLIDNAVKYTEEGTIMVEARGTGKNLILKVSDTGIGMPKESLDRIFERFYRVDKGRSRKQGGTGLGLSIVKHIVEMYGGNIEVTSEVGKGSSFKIKLPYPNA